MKLIISLSLSLIFLFNHANGATLNVSVNNPGHTVSPLLWGIFFEELNHAGDGGLYAELIKNRALSQRNPSIDGYNVLSAGEASISLSNEHGLNEVLTRSLELSISSSPEPGARVALTNEGYFGIPIRPDYTQYRASFYAKATPGFTGPLVITIESRDGSVVYANAVVPSISSEFARYEVLLTPFPGLIQNPTLDNLFVISAYGPLPAGTSIYFNVISLFPPTFNNHPNGLRIDLAQKLADAKPTFFRFPGGNFLEGHTIEDRFNWEETIGDISRRPGHWGPWGYYSTDGLGLLEYLQLSEDLNAEIILGVYAGYSLNGTSVPIDQMEPFIDSALNEIEYIIGDVSTVWGARRAADGHPEPFPLTYIEIGNEDWISGDYHIRYPLFYNAIMQKYPQLIIIATQRIDGAPIPVIDDHFYPSWGWFPDNHAYYDNHDRNGSKIFVGEYATISSWDDPPVNRSSTAAAMDDAAFMTGIERNSDIVIMACYAPLFGHFNDLAWAPDGIYYNAVASVATPAWWVQHLFSTHQGNIYIPTIGTDTNTSKFFHVASLDTTTNTLILKMVNTNTEAITIDGVYLNGINGIIGPVRVTQLTGGRWDINDLENPSRVAPTTTTLPIVGGSFNYTTPAFSLTIFEFSLI